MCVCVCVLFLPMSMCIEALTVERAAAHETARRQMQKLSDFSLMTFDLAQYFSLLVQKQQLRLIGSTPEPIVGKEHFVYRHVGAPYRKYLCARACVSSYILEY